MSNSFETQRIRMTPDATVDWVHVTHDWGEVFFAEDAELVVRENLETLCITGGASMVGGNRLCDTESDGVLWQVGGIALKHYTSLSAPDTLNVAKANVTLGVGLERINACTEGRRLRAPAYFALVRPKRDWMDRGGCDGLAMAFIEGRRPTEQEFMVGLEERQTLYDEAIRACGGNPRDYIRDEAPRNYLLGADGRAYKLDIDIQ